MMKSVQDVIRNYVSEEDSDILIEYKVEMLYNARKYNENTMIHFHHGYDIGRDFIIEGNKNRIKKLLKKFYREYLKHKEENSLISFLKMINNGFNSKNVVEVEE